MSPHTPVGFWTQTRLPVPNPASRGFACAPCPEGSKRGGPCKTLSLRSPRFLHLPFVLLLAVVWSSCWIMVLTRPCGTSRDTPLSTTQPRTATGRTSNW